MTVETQADSSEAVADTAVEPETAADTAADQASEGRQTPVGGGTGRRWTAVAALICLVLAAVTILQVLQLRSADAEQRDVAEASATARTSVVSLLSYDYRTITADMARARTGLTPAFAAQYDQVSASTVVPAATSQKVITAAAVTGSSVVSHADDEVVLLLFVNQSSTSSVSDKPQRGIDLSRVRVTMQRVGEAWRIADVRGI